MERINPKNVIEPLTIEFSGSIPESPINSTERRLAKAIGDEIRRWKEADDVEEIEEFVFDEPEILCREGEADPDESFSSDEGEDTKASEPETSSRVFPRVYESHFNLIGTYSQGFEFLFNLATSPCKDRQ